VSLVVVRAFGPLSGEQCGGLMLCADLVFVYDL
jgi:hypothetical protein